jgi:hypothetical protein
MNATLPQRPSQWLSLATAAASAAMALWLALHHPLSPAGAVFGVVAAAAVAARWWTCTPALLALVPLIGLAPWSGWITFEELDLLVLAVAAGAYAALALSLPPRERAPAWRQELAYSPPVILLMLLFGGSLLLAMLRGFADAGGFAFGWWQGYHEPMNSLRQVKAFFLAALLLPVWVQAAAVRPRTLNAALQWGMVAALVGMSLGAVWERQAFPGLLNFSTDYRTTSLFWEMHVGGAALDGALALTMPFVLIALLREQRPLRFGLLMGVVVLGLYACLTTFSRGVYAAVPAGLLVLLLLRGAQWRRASRQKVLEIRPLLSVPTPAKVGALLLLLGFAGGVLTMFGSSGYRGMLALLGAMMVLLTMPASQWLPSRAQRFTGTLMGALLALLAVGICASMTIYVNKSAYVSFVVALCVALLLRRLNMPGQARPVQSCLLSAAWYWVLFCVVLVADSWGGTGARDDALAVVVPLALVWPVMLMWPALWPFKTLGSLGWRQRGLVFSALLLVAAVVAILGGGVYLRDRMATVAEDMGTRLAHWRQGVSMLHDTQELLLGRGAGRFVADRFFEGPAQDHTGDYRLQDGVQQSYLVLSGGHEINSFGQQFRVTQRIASPQGKTTASGRVRTAKDLAMQVEICAKHLLYPDGCVVQRVKLKGDAKAWQPFSADLGMGGGAALRGDFWAPRLITFSVSIETPDGVVDLDDLQLNDATGPLLANGSFAQGMAHWFFSSDRNHLPWHIKNLGLHVLFEQGVIGVLLFGVLLGLALWRLCFGRGRDQALAPPLAGALVGFVCVGAFDSLLDVPRVSFIFFALVLFSLGLRALPGAGVEK